MAVRKYLGYEEKYVFTHREYKPSKCAFLHVGNAFAFCTQICYKLTVEGGEIDEYKRVFTAAYMSPENNNISIFILNDSEKEMSSTINLHAVNGKTFYKYVINESEISSSNFELNSI